VNWNELSETLWWPIEGTTPYPVMSLMLYSQVVFVGILASTVSRCCPLPRALRTTRGECLCSYLISPSISSHLLSPLITVSHWFIQKPNSTYQSQGHLKFFRVSITSLLVSAMLHFMTAPCQHFVTWSLEN